jgi:hypothetical protein
MNIYYRITASLPIPLPQYISVWWMGKGMHAVLLIQITKDLGQGLFPKDVDSRYTIEVTISPWIGHTLIVYNLENDRRKIL